MRRHSPGTFGTPLRNALVWAGLVGACVLLSSVLVRSDDYALLGWALALVAAVLALKVATVHAIMRKAARLDCMDCPPPPDLVSESDPFCFNPAASPRSTVPAQGGVDAGDRAGSNRQGLRRVEPGSGSGQGPGDALG